MAGRWLPPRGAGKVRAMHRTLPAIAGDFAAGRRAARGSRVVFNIPRGAQGEQGIQGPPGEVTNAAMAGAIASAIAGTANNTNSVLTMDTPLADPDSEALRLKINELILAQRR